MTYTQRRSLPDVEQIFDGVSSGKYAGKVVAVSKLDGAVLGAADSTEELELLVCLTHPNIPFRPLCCPG